MQNMKELDTINTWLGGHAITLDGFKKLVQNKSTIKVCEIGCGGGDNLLAIYTWCRKKNIEVKIIGIDNNKDCINIASNRLQFASAKFITADYKTVQFENEKPDIIFSSLFCHHFTNEELVYMLGWMKRNSAIGFFINDLHRHFLAYYSIKILTGLFSKSYLVKNDAPLSVKRGFVKEEWKDLLDKSGTPGYIIEWKWAFRWLIICRHL